MIHGGDSGGFDGGHGGHGGDSGGHAGHGGDGASHASGAGAHGHAHDASAFTPGDSAGASAAPKLNPIAHAVNTAKVHLNEHYPNDPEGVKAALKQFKQAARKVTGVPKDRYVLEEDIKKIAQAVYNDRSQFANGTEWDETVAQNITAGQLKYAALKEDRVAETVAESVVKPGFASRILNAAARNRGAAVVIPLAATAGAAILLPNKKHESQNPDGTTSEKSSWGGIKTTAVALGGFGSASMAGVAYFPKEAAAVVGKLSPAIASKILIAAQAAGRAI